MVSVVPHNECGMHLVNSHHSSDQVLVNTLTGEEQIILQSDQMVQNAESYQMHFNKKRMAYLQSGIGKLWVSGLKWKKSAFRDQSGRIGVEDKTSGAKSYPDDPEVLMQRATRTLKFTSKWDLVFTTFQMDRHIMTSRLGPIPHQLGGRTFWDIRCVKNTLMDTGPLQVREDIAQIASDGTREKRNYHNVYSRWEQLYTLGVVYIQAHIGFFRKRRLISRGHREACFFFASADKC